MDILQLLKQPWHWSVSGMIVALLMIFLLFFNKALGISSTYRTLCTIGGAGKLSPYFQFDWKTQLWNLVFAFGVVVGGVIASEFLMATSDFTLSHNTADYLRKTGFTVPSTLSDLGDYLPQELFAMDNFGIRNGLILVAGGILVGFGTRWAGGCTAGHFVSGLSNLQTASLITLVGFFIGGIISTNLLLPLLF